MGHSIDQDPEPRVAKRRCTARAREQAQRKIADASYTLRRVEEIGAAAVVAELAEPVAAETILLLIVADFAKSIAVTWLEAELSTLLFC